MKKRSLRFLKHMLLTILLLITTAVIIGLQIGAQVNYSEKAGRMNLDKEGPYVFYTNDSTLQVNYIRGNKDEGFYTESKEHPAKAGLKASCFFPLDSTDFEFSIQEDFSTPPAVYNDKQAILAISDIESAYKTFRDYLISNKVIDKKLNWTFGKGHLVLLGDFVDRGYSTTQVLWFIYKLEQEARKQGGTVHFILGNHELKNMQGRHGAAASKYHGVAAILGKQQHELYGPTSFLGKWMASKNTVELINGQLFAHGGIHPDVANTNFKLEEINHLIRKNYRTAAYPKADKSPEDILISNREGVAWYRGYFKDELNADQIDKVLEKYQARSIIVGHTIQPKVNAYFQNKVIAIDIKHRKDYRNQWPTQDSEGLLIEDDRYFRLLADGRRFELDD